MTAQFGDRLLFEGQWRTIHANPLEALFEAGFPRPYSVLRGQGAITANWRGYIASWEIRDDALLLLDILSLVSTGKSTGAMRELFDDKGRLQPLCFHCRKPFSLARLGQLSTMAPFFCPQCGGYQQWRNCPECQRKCDLAACFCPWCSTSLGEWRCDTCNGTAVDWMTARPPLPPPGSFCIRCGQQIPAGEKTAEEAGIAPVQATWYTGVLEIPCGKRIGHAHAGVGDIYESDVLIHVEEGRVIKRETRENTSEKYREQSQRVESPKRPFGMRRGVKRWLSFHQEVLSSGKSHGQQGEPSVVSHSASAQGARESQRRSAEFSGPDRRFGRPGANLFAREAGASGAGRSQAGAWERDGKDDQAGLSDGGVNPWESEAYYKQVQWFFDRKRQKPPIENSFVLSNGRRVHITQLFQRQTYYDHLVGMSTVGLNRGLIERLLEIAKERIAGATRPHLIPPKADTYPCGAGEQESATRHPIAQILPSITCFAQLESRVPARDPQRTMSCLTVVWFQDALAFPIDPEVHQQLVQLDWNRLATDCDCC
jgi:hypothetical protein